MEGKIVDVCISEAKVEIKTVVQGKRGRPRGKYSDPQKPYVISMRISDDEMLRIHELMRATNKGASELMREAFHLFTSEVTFDRTASAT